MFTRSCENGKSVTKESEVGENCLTKSILTHVYESRVCTHWNLKFHLNNFATITSISMNFPRMMITNLREPPSQHKQISTLAIVIHKQLHIHKGICDIFNGQFRKLLEDMTKFSEFLSFFTRNQKFLTPNKKVTVIYDNAPPQRNISTLTSSGTRITAIPRYLPFWKITYNQGCTAKYFGAYTLNWKRAFLNFLKGFFNKRLKFR